MIARKYLYLIALARERHFGRAAARCHVSPSTLSSAIRDLESELGVPIVERGQHFAGLTPEGECVVEYAQRVAASSEGLRQELAKFRGGLSGRVTLGVIPTATTVVAQLTAGFNRRHPKVTIEVLSLSTGEILQRLHQFEVDGGIIYTDHSREPGLRILPCWDERHVLLTARGGAFDERESIRWDEAATLPLCLLTRDMQNRKTIDEVFLSIGVQVEPTLETNSLIGLLAHTCTGNWSTIVPASVLETVGIPHRLVSLPLVEPEVAWRCGLVVLERTPQPPLIDALVAETTALGAPFGKFE